MCSLPADSSLISIEQKTTRRHMINTPLQLDEWYKDNMNYTVKVKLLKKNFTLYHMEAVHREVIPELENISIVYSNLNSCSSRHVHKITSWRNEN